MSDGKPYRKQRRIYLISRGNKWEKHGNRNVRIIRGDTFSINVKYPFTNSREGKWIKGTADFGAFNPIVGELVALAEQNLEGYTARVDFTFPFQLNST